MKNKAKHLTESGELEVMLEDISVIFKYLEDRCAFAQVKLASFSFETHVLGITLLTPPNIHSFMHNAWLRG